MLDLLIPTNQIHFLYHFFLTVGILSPFLFAWFMGKKEGFPMSTWLTALAVVGCLMIIGARLGAFQIEEWYMLFQKGTWYRETPKTVIGSIILGILGFQIMKRAFDMPAKAADFFVLGLPIGGVIGRIGCLMAGCCYGVQSDGLWSIRFGEGSSVFTAQQEAGLLPTDALYSLPVHPVQLDLILGNAIIFAFAYFYRKRFKVGHLTYFILILMACNRFGSEIFRDVVTNRGETGQLFFGLKLVQWLCILFALISAFLWIKNKKRKTKPSNSFHAKPLYTFIAIMLPTSALLWVFRGRLGILETLTFILVCLPALISILYEVVQYELVAWKKLPAIAMFSGVFFLQVQVQRDSLGELPLFKEKWWTIGSGYGYARYNDYDATTTGSGCDSRTTVHRDRDVSANMYGFEATRHTLDDEKHFAVRMRTGFGYARTIRGYQKSEGYFGLGGVYGTVDLKRIGFGFGLTGLSPGAVNHLGTDVGNKSNIVPAFSGRLGRRERLSADMKYREQNQFLYYPMPDLSLGLNWGFNDLYGQNRLRLGFAGLGRKAGVAYFGSGSAMAIKDKLSIEFAVYLTEKKSDKYAVSMGLKYMLK